MDDYELACRTRAEAEEILASLQTHADEFELQLNAFKTRIVEMPVPSADEWRRTLASFTFGDTEAKQKRDLLDYFDLTFTLAKRYPSLSVTAYALRRLAAEELNLETWALQQALAVQAAVGESDALPHALEVLLANRARGAQLNEVLITKALNELVLQHAPLREHSEVAWSIWAAMALGYQLNADATREISRMENSVVALLALDALRHGALDPTLDTGAWRSQMITGALNGPHWLLSYEANVKGWLPSKGSTDHVAGDPPFAFLKAHKVHFYDEVDPDEALDSLRGFLNKPTGYETTLEIDMDDTIAALYEISRELEDE